MDPNATLRMLLDACRDGDREAALDAVEALNDWLAHGGALPAGGYVFTNSELHALSTALLMLYARAFVKAGPNPSEHTKGKLAEIVDLGLRLSPPDETDTPKPH